MVEHLAQQNMLNNGVQLTVEYHIIQKGNKSFYLAVKYAM